MKDFKQYYQVILEDAKTTGQLPRIRDYVAIKLAENVFPLILAILTVVFASYGLFGTTDENKSQWALNSANLCLGVFLGLFAGRKLK